jgi:hypothetical protein
VSHKNKNSDKLPHHLYEVIDKKDNDTFKYGISSDLIEEDGLSRRIRIQLRLLNVIAGWKRFFARILLKDISDRSTARKIEKSTLCNMKLKIIDDQEAICKHKKVV